MYFAKSATLKKADCKKVNPLPTEQIVGIPAKIIDVDAHYVERLIE